LSTNVKNPTATLYARVIKTKLCTTCVEMAEMMVPLINKKFAMTANVTTELLI